MSEPLLHRRHWLTTGMTTLSAIASGSAAGNGLREPHEPARTRPVVLVHGAWYGGWCWRKLLPWLQQAGLQVYTPTLTGLGERSHLARPEINLEQHAQDVVALLEMEDLRDVTLVGHSYAGAVIGVAAARARPRIRQLIYLDAFVPERGRRVVDYLLPVDRREAIVKAGEASGYVAAIPPQALGVTDAKDIEWINPRLARQPYATFSQAMPVDAPADLPRGYIACTQPASGSFGQFATKIKADPAWRYRELATGHNAMIIAPELLARTLIDRVG